MSAMPQIDRWYRHRWPWLLMLGPAVAVVAGVITMVIAYRTADGLVADDYYKQGLAINQRMAREAFAREHGVRASLRAENGYLDLRVSAHERVPIEQVTLRFVHATRSTDDRIAPLTYVGDGHFRAAMPELGDATYRVQLEAKDWRLSAVLDRSLVRSPAGMPLSAP